MGKFVITSPEGRDYEVTAPDGASQEDVLAYAKSQFGQQPQQQQQQQQPAPETPKTTLSGVGSEVGKGLLRGASDVGMGVGTTATNMLGPFLGPVARRGIEALSAPSREMVSPSPGTPTEQFAGTTAEIVGGGAAGGGFGSIPRAIGTAASAFGGAAGEQVGGETGQFVGTLAPAAASPIRSLAHAIRNKVYPTAGAIGVRAAGDRSQAVIDALRTEKSNVPGVNLTAGQASVPANSPEFAALQRKVAEGESVATYAGPKGISGQQEAARVGAVRQDISGTPDKLTEAVKTRALASDANYKDAFEHVVKRDKELRELWKNPYFKDEVGEAWKLMRAEASKRGEKMPLSKNLPQFLHFVKEGLDARLQTLSNPQLPAISKSSKDAVLTAKEKLLTWLEARNPDYQTARTTHAELSKPVNQMKVGQDVERALVAPATEAERAGSFANAVRKAETTVSKSTGKPRIEDLSTKQRATIDALESDYKRDANFSELAKAGSKNLEKRIGDPEIRSFGIFNPALSFARGRINQALGTGLEKGIEKAGVAMQNPQEMARAMAQEMRKSGVGKGIPEDALYRAALATILYEGQQP